MISDGATNFIEVGPGKVLQGLVKKIDRSMETQSGS
jgi:[acyl-carrier-protein] S-malonyltransferase